MRDLYAELRDEIAGFLAEPGGEAGDSLLRVFAYQFAQNAPYQAYCRARDMPPDSIRRWQDIPAVPAEAFKTGLPLSCRPVEACQRVFQTSGTTREVKGLHYLADTGLYELTVREGWRAADLPQDLEFLFLSRAPEEVPHSSLTCMFEILHDSAPAGASFAAEGPGAAEAVRRHSATGEPFVLFATALTLRRLTKELATDPPFGTNGLPVGSWIFQTGGYKGLDEDFILEEFYDGLAMHLGVPHQRIINEYGMTELSSQAYATGLGTSHRTPPWLKVQVTDPATNALLPPGQTGYLTFYDLGNLNSVVAVRTQDFGTLLNDHEFLLHGRDPDAVPRGCSRGSDAYLQSS